MEKAEIDLLRPGTLLKIVPQSGPYKKQLPNLAMIFDMANNNFFEVSKGEYILFLEKTAFKNIIGLYEEKVVAIRRIDVEKVEL